MTVAHIGIGSNVGDRVAFCRRAVEELSQADGLTVELVSSLYETAPIGGPPQRSYVNLAVRASTELEVRDLLELCQEVERRIGRQPSEMKWGPRVIDLDILTFGDEKVNEPDLEVPHPRMTQRRFVLIPLFEIDPEASDPWGRRYADWIEEAEGDVQLLEPF